MTYISDKITYEEVWQKKRQSYIIQERSKG